MTRFEKENVAFRIEGYYIPRLDESPEGTFARARQECVYNLKLMAKLTEDMTAKQFLTVTHRSPK